MLVIPPGHTMHKIERVALGTDLNELSKKVITILEELIFEFSSELTVLSIIEKTDQHPPQQKSELEFKGLKSIYKKVEICNSINETISEYVQQNNYDLMRMNRKEKGFFQRSVTKTQVYHTKLPFLVLLENRSDSPTVFI